MEGEYALFISTLENSEWTCEAYWKTKYILKLVRRIYFL